MYERVQSFDKRVANGDDFAGDAWRHLASGWIVYVVVGHDPNAVPPEREHAPNPGDDERQTQLF